MCRQKNKSVCRSKHSRGSGNIALHHWKSLITDGVINQGSGPEIMLMAVVYRCHAH